MQHVRRFTGVYNVGYFDAGLRILFGVLCLTPFLLQDNIAWHLSDFAALLSIYPVITALDRCDPIYEYLGISTNKSDNRSNKNIQRFLDTSRNYLFSLTGVKKVHHTTTAKNDGKDHFKSVS